MRNKLEEKLFSSVGGKGVLLTSANGAYTGQRNIIQALQDSVVVVKVDWINSGATETLTVSEGSALFGGFSEITVTSGKVVAY